MSSVSRSSLENSSQRGNQGVHETEQMRLQREVDTFTVKLEHEKRRLLIVEEQIKQVKTEIGEKDEKIAHIKPTQLRAKHEKISIDSTKAILNQERLNLNQTKSTNQTIHRNIDCLRKELTSALSECTRFKTSIKKAKRNAIEQNKQCMVHERLAEEHSNQAIALMTTHEADKKKFDSDIAKMKANLQEDDGDVLLKADKMQNKTTAGEKETSGDFGNHIVVLKMRLAKIVATNREKKRLMDQYLRNVKVIEDAFEQIKESTGISSVEEIVTSFIKAEEQNYSLYNYVNMLSTEIDQLEESNGEINEHIERIKQRQDLNNQEKEELKKSMENQMNNLNKKIEKELAETESTKRTFRKIQQNVELMVQLFKRSRFYLSVATKMSYDEGFVFTENNIVAYLAELEEYICSLITYSAFKRDDPNAAISAIPLEKLIAKNHEPKNLQITLPDPSKPLTQAGLEGILDHNLDMDDEEIISAKDLYMRFQKMLKKNGEGPSVEDEIAQIEDAAGINADDLGKGEGSEEGGESDEA